MASVPSEPFSAGRLFGNIQRVFGSGPALFIGLTAAFAFAPQVLVGAVTYFGGESAGSLLNLPAVIVAGIGGLAMTWSSMRRLAGKKPDAGESISGGLKYFWPAVGIGIISNLAIAIGFVLLIAPGIFLMTVWSVALPAYIARDKGVTEALSESFDLTKGARWPIAGLLVAMWVIYLGVIFIVAAVSTVAEPLNLANQLFITPLAIAVMQALNSIALPSLYHELRYRGGAPAEATAEVFA